MMTLVLYIFLFPVSFSIKTFEKKKNNLNFVLENLHEKLFSNCNEAIYFDRSWSNTLEIFKVNTTNYKNHMSICCSNKTSSPTTIIEEESEISAGQQDTTSRLIDTDSNKEFCIVWKVFIEGHEKVRGVLARVR